MEDLKNKYAELEEKYSRMKELYKNIDSILFKNKELKNKKKLLGQEMYKVNLQQIKILHKLSGINIE